MTTARRRSFHPAGTRLQQERPGRQIPQIPASRPPNVPKYPRRVFISVKEETSMDEVVIIGIDLAKCSFQMHGARKDGSVAFRRKLSRGKLLGTAPARAPR